MKVLIVGSGGVGKSTTAIARRRDPGAPGGALKMDSGCKRARDLGAFVAPVEGASA